MGLLQTSLELVMSQTGVVDSKEDPLNISSDALQPNEWMRVINENIVRKCLAMLADVTESMDKDKRFYE